MNYAYAHSITPARLLGEDKYLDVNRSTTEETIAVIYRKSLEALEHYRRPVSRGRDISGEEKFCRLSLEWRSSVKYSSSMNKMVLHPAYQKIIGMGSDVLPFIFRELEESPNHWFWALRSITGVDPVPEQDRGKLGGMARAWLEWARGQGIRW